MSRAYEKNCCVGISRLCAQAWTLSKKSRSWTFRQLRKVTSSVASRKCQFSHDPSADGACVVCASSFAQSSATIISFRVEASGQEKTGFDKAESSDHLYQCTAQMRTSRTEPELRGLQTVSDTRLTKAKGSLCSLRPVLARRKWF